MVTPLPIFHGKRFSQWLSVYRSLTCISYSDSALAQDPAAIKCSAQVTKEFSSCEHAATVACSTDIDSVPCRSLCDVAFTCCTRTCKALCHTCKALSQSKKQQSDGHTSRSTHPRHKCDRPLLCSHSCLGTCEAGHECGPCTQQRIKTCIHAQKSRARCCEPMKPCTQGFAFMFKVPESYIARLGQEPCQWRCPHEGACRLPCGSVSPGLFIQTGFLTYAVLHMTSHSHAIDYRAIDAARRQQPAVISVHPVSNPLLVFCFGHATDSAENRPVCGEKCPEDCLTCVSKKKPLEVVDHIMQRTIEDLVNEADYSSTDNIVLALHCGHMLTVESADGIAGLSSFYEQDKNGNWTRPVAPSESVSAPRCPSCRAPFSVNRYGRVFKKTDVDLSEQSLVGTSNSRLIDIQRRLDALKHIQLPEIENGPEEFYTDSRYEKSKIRVNHGLVTAFEAKRTVDISLFTEKLWKTFGINNKAATLWEGQTGSEIKLLREANAVIKQSSPQQNAWDASYAKLFRAEMATGKCRPEGAQVLARRSLGTPRPSGKQQYAIQATLLSIQIRHRLARIAQQFSEATKDEAGKRHWDLLASILLTSTVMDAETVKGDACEAVLRRSYYAASHYCRSFAKRAHLICADYSILFNRSLVCFPVLPTLCLNQASPNLVQRRSTESCQRLESSYGSSTGHRAGIDGRSQVGHAQLCRRRQDCRVPSIVPGSGGEDHGGME